MAAEFYYKHGGVWRKAKEVYYKHAGTWRKAKEIWYRTGGVWRLVFPGGVIVNPLGALNVTDTEVSPTQALGRVTFNTDGSISYVGNGSGGAANWFEPTTPGIGNNYWLRVTNNGGDLWDESYVSGSLVALSTARQFTWSVVGGVRNAQANVQIYSDSGGTNLVSSGTISGTIESSL